MSSPSASTPTPDRDPFAEAPAGFEIEEGSSWAYFAYDIGRAVDLDAAEQLLASRGQREGLRQQQKAPRSLQFKPAPLRVDQLAEPIAIGGFQTLPGVECTLFDFGAVSVAYQIPIRGTPATLLPLSEALYENAQLLADSRRRAAQTLREIGPAVIEPGLAEVSEDYVIHHARRWRGSTPPAVFAGPERAAIAAILRAESGGLSDQEIDEALACRIAFSPRDAAVIDWNSALVLDEQGEDTLAVLEFANVELLELRFLDDRLDAILDSAYKAMHDRSSLRRTLLGADAGERRRVAALQVDSAVLFEGVNNAIKLVGDQYLARLYRFAAQRLHLAEWDASVIRKLQTIDGIYQKLVDKAASRRLEVLEWIVIILIATEILLSFAARGR